MRRCFTLPRSPSATLAADSLTVADITSTCLSLTRQQAYVALRRSGLTVIVLVTALQRRGRTMSGVPCKFGTSCSRPDCFFSHPVRLQIYLSAESSDDMLETHRSKISRSILLCAPEETRAVTMCTRLIAEWASDRCHRWSVTWRTGNAHGLLCALRASRAFHAAIHAVCR